MLNAKIISKSESSRGYVTFEATAMQPITEQQAAVAQAKLGYPVPGYGMYDLKVKGDPVLMTYKATWRCSVSCD
jgi:hypothetical protein